MNKKMSVLIIEDHPMVANVYKMALDQIAKENAKYDFSINMVNNCDTGIEAIIKASKGDGIDIVFLDISLPPSKDNKILSGEDLGLKINNLLPNTKIIVCTTFYDSFRINSIFKNVKPSAFLVKNDFDEEELKKAIVDVIMGVPAFSKTVLKIFNKRMSNDFTLDEIDRKLIFELSIGTKMKDLPQILPMSMAGIEKRKREIKIAFGIQGNNDRDLILMAKEKGFL